MGMHNGSSECSSGHSDHAYRESIDTFGGHHRYRQTLGDLSQSSDSGRSESRENTVNPRIADDCRSFWKTQFGYLGLDTFILQSNLLDLQNFFQVAGAMNIWAQPYITLYPLLRQIDGGLMEFILAVIVLVVRHTYYSEISLCMAELTVLRR